MEIKDILSKLGLDLSNPEVKRGAMEAIDAILTSRIPATAGDLGDVGGNTETEVELDPDLLQPSIKQAPSGINDDDVEIEDEENILDQIKHKDSEDPIENTNSAGDDTDNQEKQDQNTGNSEGTSSDDSTEQPSANKTDAEPENSEDTPDELEDSSEDEEDTQISTTSNEDDDTENLDDADDADDADDENAVDDAENDENSENSEDADSVDDIEFDAEADYDDIDDATDADTGENAELEDETDLDNDDIKDDEEFDFDEEDLLDDDIKDSTEDEEIKAKHDARKIKRERTLAAAKKALEDAKAKKVASSLIRELEKSIEALEALTEAVTKSLKDISDEEFNRLVNRVFDAIDACGGSDLTFTSKEEREAQVKEIKNDMSSAATQAELSAEDAAKIRAETQAVKAREKEADKYKPKARGSFKGFQDFLNSLYRAIAIQVHQEETQDDSWSALNRRNSGVGVLKQGKLVRELPNKMIPIIDFYFDCSGSWTASDIELGKKAVEALADMEEKGQIKVNIYYFSDRVSQNYEDVADGGTSAWNYIVKNIIATRANNVVIMTDSDMENMGRNRGGAEDFLKYTVPGYVWYLWKRGVNAPRLPRDLKGRGGTQQFSFDA